MDNNCDVDLLSMIRNTMFSSTVDSLFGEGVLPFSEVCV